MSKARRLYRCKICGIFLSRREKILSHFFDRHSSGQDSFEEVVLPDLKINVTRQRTTTNKNVPETILLPDNMPIKFEPNYEDLENIASPNFTFGEDDDDSSANEKYSFRINPDITVREDSELINQSVKAEDTPPTRRTLRPRNRRKIRERANSDKDEEQDDESRDNEFQVGEPDHEFDSEDDQFLEHNTKPKRKRKSISTKININNGVALMTTKIKLDDAVAKVNGNKTPSSRKKNSCPYCPAKLTSVLRLDVHIQQVHQGVEPFKCEICQKSFKSFRAVLLHIDIRHQPHTTIAPQQTDHDQDSALSNHKLDTEHLFDKIFKVEEFQTNTEVLQIEPETIPEEYTRKKKKSYEGKFCCKHCRYHFAQEWVLNAHILRYHYGDKNAFPCDHCSRRFQRKTKLYMHRKISHPSISTPYTGPKISLQEQIFQLKSRGLKDKIKPYPSVKSAPVEKFTCKICQVTLPSRTSCEIHLSRVHQTDQTKLFPCDKCDLIFLTESGRKIHLDHFHEKNISTKLHPLVCSVCNKECASVLAFSRHQEIFHSNCPRLPKEHLCELCSQAFTILFDLKQHQVRVHHAELGVDPLKCSHCGKVLNSKRSLKSHEALHGDTLPFVCTRAPCTRGFLQEADLERHVKAVHLKEKNFVCEFCSKAFAQKPNLITHLRTHTGEKPYKCKSCGKEFSDKPTYNRHVQIHGDTVHTCDKCGKKFKVWHTYKVHLKTHN
ncbi:zinc finger protein 492 [Folsomia candida]|uniref:zinc finger protein 492 n=1 Tax=Folsomia candida TaxID=158441 RepID=UPI000B8EFFBA|nr:zinc finger protein 492 [Folsomia candida]